MQSGSAVGSVRASSKSALSLWPRGPEFYFSRFCLPALADLAAGNKALFSGDCATALKEFLPLATLGNTEVQFNLGLMYGLGQGVPQDWKEAARWYRLAAEQGNAGAQNMLGILYRDGQGVPQDYKEAMKWYRPAIGALCPVS
jgi:TPR repeat protein